jgi:hypothetical protein
MPMLETNIASLEVDEYFFSFEVLLPVGEAASWTSLRWRLLNAVIGQVSAND